MSFRPTRAQAVGHGGYLGLLVGGFLGLLGLIVTGFGVGVPVAPAVLVPLGLGPVVGAVGGLVFGRGFGADIDNEGVHVVPRRPGTFAPWQRVADLRVERRGWRNQVTVWLDTGSVIRLPAPYHGSLLAADPEFERKLFMLRNLWETHRSFKIH